METVMRMPRWLGWALLVMTLSASPAFADESAQDFMKGKQTELSTLVKKGDSSKKVESVFDSLLDYDTLAQDSLKGSWTDRTDAERREFQETLKGLVQRAYRRNLDKTANYDV